MRFDIAFAPDHRALLGEVLPIAHGWPDWREGDADELRVLVTRPGREQREDAATGRLWLGSWGPQPPDVRDASRVAVARVAAAPQLVPLHAWRYVPNHPDFSGNPVFSHYSDDTIIIAEDLEHYVLQELGLRERARLPVPDRRVRFWTELTEQHAES